MWAFSVEFCWETKRSQSQERLLSLAIKTALERLPRSVLNSRLKGRKALQRIEVNLISPATIQGINTKFRKKRRPTDVLSFSQLDCAETPANQGLLGELYLCVSEAKKNAARAKILLDEELGRLAIHGTLHLFGYDHQGLADEKRMFRLQEKILQEALPAFLRKRKQERISS